MKAKILQWLFNNLKYSWSWHAIAGYIGFFIVQFITGPWIALIIVMLAAYATEEWDRLKNTAPWIDYWTTAGWKDWSWYVIGALPAFVLRAI